MSTAAVKETIRLWKDHPLSHSIPLAPRADYAMPSQADVATLSTQQKLALLQMSRRILHQAIWRAMKAKFEAAPFTLSTFRQLRELKLAEILPDQHYHSLTATGAPLCDLIGRQLVRDHNIHEAWIGGNVGPNTTLFCTCGWSCSLHRGDGMLVKAATAHSTHRRTVAAIDGLRTALVPRKAERA